MHYCRVEHHQEARNHRTSRMPHKPFSHLARAILTGKGGGVFGNRMDYVIKDDSICVCQLAPNELNQIQVSPKV